MLFFCKVTRVIKLISRVFIDIAYLFVDVVNFLDSERLFYLIGLSQSPHLTTLEIVGEIKNERDYFRIFRYSFAKRCPSIRWL
jgi:hypothetical protein